MKGILQVFYTIFSALLLSAGIPNELLHFGSPFLGLFALVPLYLSLKSCKTYKRSGCLTGLNFALVQLFSSFWLGNFNDFAVFTLWGPVIAYFFEGYLVGSVFYCVFTSFKFSKKTEALQNLTFRGAAETARRIILFAIIYTLWEWTKSSGFLAYPWGTLIMTSFLSPFLIQIADITGTWGISFLWSLFAATFAEGISLFCEFQPRIHHSIKRMYTYTVIFTAVLFCLSFVYGIVQYNKPRKIIKTANIAVIQHNTDSWFEDGDSPSIIAAERQTEQILKQTPKPDLICWSESLLTYAFPDSYDFYYSSPQSKPLIPFIKKAQTPFAIGLPVHRKINGISRFYNGAAVFNKDASIAGFSGKIHLVPFAEYIPFMENKAVRTIMNALVGFCDGWTPWNCYTVYSVPLSGSEKLHFSIPICFEDAFPDVCRGFYNTGAEVLLSISNDSWSNLKSAEFQHFVIAAFRAIELRIPLVRTTNSGYSGAVDPTGRIIKDLPLFEEASMTVTVPIFERQPTVYAKLGDWLVIVFGIAFAFFIISSTLNFKKHS